MPNDNHENSADLLVALIEDMMERPGRPHKRRFENLRDAAIALYFQIDQLHTRLAYEMRDSREAHLTMRMLYEAHLIEEGQYLQAYDLVTDGRRASNVFTDVDTIKQRNIEEMKHATSD